MMGLLAAMVVLSFFDALRGVPASRSVARGPASTSPRSSYQPAPPVVRRSGHEASKTGTTQLNDGSVTPVKMDRAYVENQGTVPGMASGTDAAKPAAATAGKIYIATDTKRIYRDTGAAWVEIARFAGNITAADLGFDPATQAELDTHAALSGLSGHIPAAGITDTHVAAANKDGADAVASMRTLGSGASQAAKGNHTHATPTIPSLLFMGLPQPGGAAVLIGSASTVFVAFGGFASATHGTEADTKQRVSSAGTLRRFRVRVVSHDLTGADTIDVTVRVNGADSVLSVQIVAGTVANAVLPDNDSVVVAADDEINLEITSGGGAPNRNIRILASVEFVPS